MKNFRFSVALDVDDLLLSCVPYAIKLCNQKYNFDPPLSIEEITGWGKLNKRTDIIFEMFQDEDFYKNQPIIPGAIEFVYKLSQIADIYISTSIAPEFMGIRAKKIMEYFPNIPINNIYMGASKDKIDVDVLFDDGGHNILSSTASYPVLMRKPWNRHITGLLAVNTYNEFLNVIETLKMKYSGIQPQKYNEPYIVALVGPSGSNKNELANELIIQNKGKLLRPNTITTSQVLNENHYYVPKENFLTMKNNDWFLETTMYAGHEYGLIKNDIDDCINRGYNLVIPIDICGAIALKTNYKNVFTVFTKRKKEDLIRNILNKNISNELKTQRILSLDLEKRNADLCDITIRTDNISDAINIINKYIL